MSEYVYAGLTSQTIDVFLRDSSSATGAGLTGLVYNSSGLKAYYRKGATGTAVQITLATQTAGGAYSSGGFVEVDATNLPGVYRLDLPNAMVDTEGFVTLILFGATNLQPTPLRIDCRPLPVDLKKIAGSAVSTGTAQLGVNVVTYASGQAPLQPTVAGRTLDVTATGAAGIDLANVENPTTTLNLSGTTISTTQQVASVSGSVGSVAGAVGSVTGNVAGNVVGSVGSISGVTFPTHFNDLEITANGHVSAAVYTIANNSITASSIQGGAITAAKFATDAISAAALAADAVQEIQSGLATSAAVAAVQSDVTTLLGRITSTLFSGITYLSRWLGALAGKTADAATQTEIRATTAGATYTITTDSLEAIRDNSGGGGGSGDASQSTLLEVQGTVDSIAASLSGTTVSVSSRVSAAGEITLWAGDDCRVRSGTQIDVTITDVGGAIYTRLDGIGLANLAWGAARIVQPAGAITGTIAALTQAGSGASQTLTISIEITDGGSDLRAADDYTWQIVSSEQHGTEYDQQVELEGSLVLRRRVAVPVY